MKESYLAGWCFNPKTGLLDIVFVDDGKVNIDSDFNKKNDSDD